MIVTCEPWDDGCQGGNAINAFRWIMANDITDETCSIYEALGRKEGKVCDDLARCKDCAPSKGCFRPERPKIYGIAGY